MVDDETQCLNVYRCQMRDVIKEKSTTKANGAGEPEKRNWNSDIHGDQLRVH